MMLNSNSDDKLTAATALAAEYGWKVLPCWWIEDGVCGCGDPDCSSPGKHPISGLVPKGLKNATADLTTIRRWWGKHPQANIGVRTGEEFWALDLDGIEGIRAFAQITENHPDLAETPTVQTGGGGRHLYFAADETIRNKAKIGGIPIDVRGHGGYILVPPSNHVSGNVYTWELPATEYEPAPAPAWLVKFATNGAGSNSTTLRLVYDGDLASHPGAAEGERNTVLCRLVGSHLATRGVTGDLVSLAVAWGQRCKPPLDEKQVTRTVMALAEKHVNASADEGVGSYASLIRYDTIEPQEIEWLWPGRIALGKFTIVSGDPGLGKTYLLLDVTARVSTGRGFPDGAPCEPAEVIFATVEDGPGDTIRPRLDLLGADVVNVMHFEGILDAEGRMQPFLFDRHLPILDRALEENDRVRLLIVDPVSAFLGDVDSHKNAEVRGVLAPLAQLAEKHHVAVVGISHLTKSQSKAIYRSLGSLAFVAAARAAWAVIADPDDQERRLFLPVKNNLSRATGLAYRIVDGRIEWESSPVLIGVDDLAEEADTPREEANAWLRNALRNGPVEAKLILKQAKSDGIAERTLRRAKKELGVQSSQFDSGWSWALPDVCQDSAGTTMGNNNAPETFTF